MSVASFEGQNSLTLNLRMGFHWIGMLFKSCQEWAVANNLMNLPAQPNKMYIPSKYEHIANTYSHSLMVLPSIFAGELLLMRLGRMFPQTIRSPDVNISRWDGWDDQDISRINYEFCSYVYGSSLALLFIFSSIYHWVSWTQSLWIKNNLGCSRNRPSLARVLHQCDRSTIYIFIAASYTPWLMLSDLEYHLPGMEWSVWVGAIFGTVYTLFYLEKNKLLELLFYMLIGVLPGVFLILFNSASLDETAIYELKLGGFFYLVGVIIFKCDGLIPFAHAIWHLFVAMGAFTHYMSVFRFFYS